MKKYKIAVLDDYQTVALESADWSVFRDRAVETTCTGRDSTKSLEVSPKAAAILSLSSLVIGSPNEIGPWRIVMR
jgi:hypothetical protein